MALPQALQKLSLPIIGSPLFIISNPRLVIEQCKAGVVGSMPALNARPASQLEDWLAEITETLAAYNAAHPDQPAGIMSDGSGGLTYAQLEDRANRGAQLLRSLGIAAGDTIAYWLPNCPDVYEIYWAGQRAGVYITPIATALTTGEADYIIEKVPEVVNYLRNMSPVWRDLKEGKKPYVIQ